MRRAAQRHHQRQHAQAHDHQERQRDEAGKRPKGKIGADVHDLFRSVEAAMFLDGKGTDAKVDQLIALSQDPDTTPQEAAHLEMQAKLVALVGNWSKRSAEDRERLSSSLFQNLHEGLVIVDSDQRILDVNPTYSRITGVPREELIGAVPTLLSSSATESSSAKPTVSVPIVSSAKIGRAHV